MTKPTKWLCAQRWLRSAWASTQSDQSLLCAQWVAKDPSFLHADCEDSDLSLHLAHSHFVGFVMRQLICCGYSLEFWEIWKTITSLSANTTIQLFIWMTIEIQGSLFCLLSPYWHIKHSHPKHSWTFMIIGLSIACKNCIAVYYNTEVLYCDAYWEHIEQ